MTKITFLIGRFRSSGTEKVCVTLANSFIKRGIKVELVVLNLNDAVMDKELNIDVKLINLNIKNARKSFFVIKKYIKENRPKKFLVFNFQLAMLLIIIRSIFNFNFEIISRNIITLSKRKENTDSFWHGVVIDFFAKIIYKKVDKLIAQSHGMANDLIENYRFDPSKISIINNPINQDIEKYLKSNNQLTSLQKNNEILFIGRLESEKGLHYLLKAFSKLNNKDVILRLIGKGSLEHELKSLSISLALDGRVIFDGFKNDVIPYILNAKAIVLTSIYEGFPNVLVESIALGTPVVAFDCQSGPSEIIIDNLNGFLVKYLNIEDLTNKLDLALKKEWNVDAIKESAKKYSSHEIINKYLDVVK